MNYFYMSISDQILKKPEASSEVGQLPPSSQRGPNGAPVHTS